MTTTFEPLLTPGETARRLFISPSTLIHWVKAGRIHPVRTIGGHRRYKTSEVEALLANPPRRGNPTEG